MSQLSSKLKTLSKKLLRFLTDHFGKYVPIQSKTVFFECFLGQSYGDQPKYIYEEMLRRGFLDLGLETIWCGYFDGNLKSRRVQEKCGFLYRFTRKNVPVPSLGGVRAEHFSCLTKEQWLAR